MLGLALRQSTSKNSRVEPARLLTVAFLGAGGQHQNSGGNIRCLRQTPHPPSGRSPLLQHPQPAYYLSSSVFMSMATGGEGASGGEGSPSPPSQAHQQAGQGEVTLPTATCTQPC
ncbi:hypothetical protein E3U43_012305 [Larimichthys crocea]|uniref:Uncharacterized protein n=1 Tax=Larimichthys crocea TaxID=215358 RepID=A0ACD3RRM8_LARCR|nr:hypothetical protein E3U43_012305 [Larimichthys crocea]